MEHHEGLGLVFRVLAWCIAGWTLFLVFQKILRKADIIPWPPFKSREEYITGAIEMDLDEFAQRAKVTPRHVIARPQPTAEPAADLPLTIGCAPGTVIGVAIAAMLQDILVTPEGQKNRQLPEKFPAGRWFRCKTEGAGSVKMGELVEVVSVWDGVVTVKFPGGITSFLPEHLVPAYPWVDEWWQWTTNVRLNGQKTLSQNPFQWQFCLGTDEQYRPPYLREVEAGNLIPVNFGKGVSNLEKKEPVSAPWAPERKLQYENVFLPGRWVRESGSGKLLQVIRTWGESNPLVTCVAEKGAVVSYLPGALEPAYPRTGEWWRWQDLPGSSSKWLGGVSYELKERVDAGRLIPVNFGKG